MTTMTTTRSQALKAEDAEDRIVKDRPFLGKIQRCDTWWFQDTAHANLRRCPHMASQDLVIAKPNGQLVRMLRCEACAEALRLALPIDVEPETAVAQPVHQPSAARRKTPYWMEQAGKAGAEAAEREERLGQYRSASNLRQAIMERPRRQNALVNQALAAQVRTLTAVEADEINKKLFG
jgi:hypothetical protein